MWMRGPMVPVDRLIANVGRYVRENPNDAKGHYVLARAHSWAFAHGDHQIELAPRSGDAPMVEFHPSDSVRMHRTTGGLRNAASLDHLARSIEHYAKATEFAPDKALYWLGYASVLEQASEVAAAPATQVTTQPATLPATAPALPSLREARERALAAYQKAHDVSRSADLQRKHFGPGADDFISLEAVKCMQ